MRIMMMIKAGIPILSPVTYSGTVYYAGMLFVGVVLFPFIVVSELLLFAGGGSIVCSD